MRRGQSVDSSLDEYEPIDSETEYASGTETESTDDDDFDELLEDIEDVQDAEGEIDCAYLLGDDAHPPKYYLKQMDDFDKSEFTTEDYSDGTTHLLNQIEEQWYR